MPTKKPIVSTVLEDTIYEKFLKISEKERRSKSQLAAIAIEEFVERYERRSIANAADKFNKSDDEELKPFA
ncbi:MAG: hypothetical protein NC131_12505 [Roseburia sp.]|nr:hypothetical protein [Roseburia sp.]